MALESLYKKIEFLNSRIQKHGDTLRLNEFRTRVALIDPLLNELGWDVSDPEQVSVEYGEKKGGPAVDYALLDSNGRPIMVLEAKKLGTNLSSSFIQMQIVNYAVYSGIRFAGLTDGNQWVFYDVLQQVALDEKRIFDISILESPFYESALKLLLLWHPNLASGQPVSAVASITVDHRDVQEVDERDRQEQSQSERVWKQFVEYNPPTSTKPPTAIRFWDESQYNLTYWYELLTLIVEKLHIEKLIKNSDVPIFAGPSRYLVNTKPEHPNGERFHSYRQIRGTSLYVFTHLSAQLVRTNARKLLESFSPNSSSVYIKVD